MIFKWLDWQEQISASEGFEPVSSKNILIQKCGVFYAFYLDKTLCFTFYTELLESNNLVINLIWIYRELHWFQPCNFSYDPINITMVILEKRNMNMNTTKFMKIWNILLWNLFFKKYLLFSWLYHLNFIVTTI